MKMKVILGGIAILILLLVVAGCTQPTAPQATPAPTPEATAAPVVTTTAVPTTFVPATPGPTQTLQANWAVQVAVNSNGQAVNPQVIYTFNGGLGMNLIPEIDVQLTKTDGTVETGKFVQGTNMDMGETVSLPGSTGNNDRAEVWVITPQGDRVKIVDKYVPFRSYN